VAPGSHLGQVGGEGHAHPGRCLFRGSLAVPVGAGGAVGRIEAESTVGALHGSPGAHVPGEPLGSDPPLQWLMGAMSAYVDPDELMLFSAGMVLGVDTLDYMVDVVLDRRLSRADHRKLSLALERKGGKLPVRVDEVVHLVTQPPSARPN